METYFDFAVDRFRRPQSTWVNRSLRLAFKVMLNFLEAHRGLCTMNGKFPFPMTQNYTMTKKLP